MDDLANEIARQAHLIVEADRADETLDAWLDAALLDAMLPEELMLEA